MRSPKEPEEIESIPFQAPDTWGYSMIYPVLLVLASNGLGHRHPELGISGRTMVMGEEVGTLRSRGSRGYRGLCLAGFGDDGWLANWHQATDDTAHLKPSGIEKAARFAWQMLRTLDAHPPD